LERFTYIFFRYLFQGITGEWGGEFIFSNWGFGNKLDFSRLFPYKILLVLRVCFPGGGADPKIGFGKGGEKFFAPIKKFLSIEYIFCKRGGKNGCWLMCFPIFAFPVTRD